MSYVETPAGRLFHEEAGSGPPVLLWHAFLCDRTMWRPQVAALSSRYRLILVDGPGHGLSSAPPPGFTLADCAVAALQVLDAAGVERAFLGGISWGGIVAMQAALRAPARVQGLLLLSTSAEAEGRFDRLRARVLARIARRYGVPKALEPFVVSSFFSRRARRERPGLGESLLLGIRDGDREARFRVMTAILDRPSFLDELARIRVPTLVIAASEDRVTAPARGERIAQRIPGARVETIEGSGHLSPLEAPEQVSALLEQFLAQACQA